MAREIHIQVRHGDVVYVHRAAHWHVERFEYSTAGFNKTGELIEHDCPGDVLTAWANDPDSYKTLEEADALVESEDSGDLMI